MFVCTMLELEKKQHIIENLFRKKWLGDSAENAKHI